jgi:hypothetical protein
MSIRAFERCRQVWPSHRIRTEGASSSEAGGVAPDHSDTSRSEPFGLDQIALMAGFQQRLRDRFNQVRRPANEDLRSFGRRKADWMYRRRSGRMVSTTMPSSR